MGADVRMNELNRKQAVRSRTFFIRNDYLLSEGLLFNFHVAADLGANSIKNQDEQQRCKSSLFPNMRDVENINRFRIVPLACCFVTTSKLIA